PGVAITTTSLPSATVDTPYSATLAASGGTTPYIWSITSASPPSWLTLDPATGALSGTPTTSGVQDVTFEVTDADTLTDSVTLALTVVASGPYSPLAP